MEMRKTKKLYYSDFGMSECVARVVKVHPGAIELEETVAYPEGGGQDPDHGTLINLKDGCKADFDFVKRIYGRDEKISEEQWVNVDGIILHQVKDAPENLQELFDVGDEVKVIVDMERRLALSESHSASHLLYMGVLKERPEVISRVIGCHISIGKARFDFSTEDRFTSDEIIRIEEYVNDLIDRELPIKVFESDMHPDARYWECDGVVIPCGGTHISNTGTLQKLKVKRKGIGKGRERISCSFS